MRITYRPRNAFIVREIFRNRCYAPVEFVKDVTCILDVGANIGASAIFFRFAYPGARIHAFEPGRGAYELLQRNAAPYPEIKTYPVGLWSEDKEAELFVGDHDYATASLADQGTANRATDRVRLRGCRGYLAETGIDRVDVAKIDTEGCEIPILRDLLAVYAAKVIYLEFHSEEDRIRIDSMLREAYSLFAARIVHLHRGTLCYVARREVDANSDYHRHRIVVSA